MTTSAINRAYTEGQNACFDGLSLDACPYADDLGDAWQAGFLDAEGTREAWADMCDDAMEG